MRFALVIGFLAFSAAAQGQWMLLDSHSTADFRGVASVGKGIVWVSGSNGTVLRSEDGGYLWQRCSVPPGADKLDFRGIQAFDANTAIVMSSGKGDLSRLYKTTDGCQTWKLVFTNPDQDGFWDAIQVPAPESNTTFPISGVLIGDPVNGSFPIFVTPDSGDTWRRWGVSGSGGNGQCGERNVSASKDEALFAASNETLLFDRSETTILFVTGGPSGSRVVYSPMRFGDSPPCRTSFLADHLIFGKPAASSGAFAAAGSQTINGLPEKLLIVGGDYSKLDTSTQTNVLVQRRGFHIPFTSYFEKSILSTTPPHGYRSAVSYDASTKTWITVGPNGTDISTDDGRNWRALKPGPADAPDADQHWNALSLPFVVGPHGRIGVLNSASLKGLSK